MKIIKTATLKYLAPLFCIASLAGLPTSFAYADNATASQSQIADERMDLNLVTAEQLATLPGIGKKKAESIIRYREDKGRFLEVEQLTEVKGIGPKLLAKIQSKLQVSE